MLNELTLSIDVQRFFSILLTQKDILFWKTIFYQKQIWKNNFLAFLYMQRIIEKKNKILEQIFLTEIDRKTKN